MLNRAATLVRHRRTGLARSAVVALVAVGSIAGVVGLAPSADALTTGYKAVASSSASGVSGKHTGFGPGWVALTFDTNGSPHGPIIGYLFHDGTAQAAGNDHMQVSSYFTRGAASVPTPFAGGYAYGNFNGCAWSYLDDGGDELSAASGSGTNCTPPNHTTKIFCTDHDADRLCSDGSGTGEGEPGVWRHIENHIATIGEHGCDVYGNVGSAAIYHGAAATPRNLIKHVDSGTVQVRYVIAHGDWVMANLTKSGSPQLPAYLEWGFYPRSCLNA